MDEAQVACNWCGQGACRVGLLDMMRVNVVPEHGVRTTQPAPAYAVRHVGSEVTV